MNTKTKKKLRSQPPATYNASRTVHQVLDFLGPENKIKEHSYVKNVEEKGAKAASP